ncbi:MAG: hypothetical protein WCQ96_03840 [Patescibacteria group bacterium]
MAENKWLENISAEEFRNLHPDSIVQSEDGKMLVVKKNLYWEILCLASVKPENPPSRYLCITYNEIYLGKIFGHAVNSYTNFITGNETAAKHFHKNFKEIFCVESLTSSLLVTLKNPETEETAELKLNGKLVEFDGRRWLREIIVPEGIAHKLHNPNEGTVAVAVTTSGQHAPDDVIAYEM